MDVRVFRDTKAILGESLVWDPGTDETAAAMMWCDISAGLIHRSPLDGATDGADDSTISLPPPVASFHPAVSGGLVVSLGDRIVLTDPAGVIIHTLATIEHGPHLRLNEGKVDPRGRWLTGSMNIHDESPDGALYAVDHTGRFHTLYGGLGVANGLEWSLDGSRVYFTDTSVRSIYTAAYTSAGEMLEVTLWHHGTPNDGLAIDDDGCLWSGLYGEGRVERYDPDGQLLSSIELPVPNVTSVAFGGAGLGTLFVCSARENLTEEQLEAHPLSGAVFAIETSTSGLPTRPFG
jgi:sugar lactone lactonase YvrE